jgi:hypothetical protein
MPKFITDNAGAFLIIAFVAFVFLLNIGADFGIVPGKAVNLLVNLAAVAFVAVCATDFFN